MGKKSRTKREAALSGSPEAAARMSPAADNKLIIPKEINGRFLGRIVLFSGVPFALALSVQLIGATLIRAGYPLPSAVVLLVNLLFLGISVLGITYAILSASWNPQVPGSLLGIREFKENGGRLLAALQHEGQKRRVEKKS
ncbi:PAM68 family protein [Gloeobacter morelensis]|uniref:PAM68 family protein n=1 Tax=Gloeobacter morelensis MG652769 TaxID=2781736 RepID=A0ABY3PJN6_9CYAN|nr:PAM68 family protein [Gloeobacter morelensis]UFP93862.1 PAM68 family protein [Gloeobacter morelensis MG652769]